MDIYLELQNPAIRGSSLSALLGAVCSSKHTLTMLANPDIVIEIVWDNPNLVKVLLEDLKTS